MDGDDSPPDDLPGDAAAEFPDWTPLFERLFPQGLGGADVLSELAPGGWAASPFVAVFHPSPERVLEESLAFHRNLRDLPWRKGKTDDTPEPTLASVMESYRETPIEPSREAGDLLGMCLWDIFSDNHDVVTDDGQVVDIGSFRGSAGFIANFLDRSLGRFEHDYMDFYMGTFGVHGRADMMPVYELIFRRLQSQGLDWAYSFPRLHIIDFRPLRDQLEASGDARPEWERYSPSDSFAAQTEEAERDREIERMREELAQAHAEAVKESREGPPPRTVEAYRSVYGRYPKGWPP